MTTALTVICAWCTRQLSPGAATDKVSHGICPECLSRLESELS